MQRRDLMRSAIAAAAVAGAAALAARAEAAPPAIQLPGTKNDNTRTPIHIAAETGVEVSGVLDLTTVVQDRDAADEKQLTCELRLDTFGTRQHVRTLTDKIEKLALVDPERHRPPVCIVTWGQSLQFGAIIESVDVGYTMFSPDGVPLRATCRVSFKEFTPAEEQLKGSPRH